LIQPTDAKLTLGYQDVAELAQKLGRASEPVIRQRLAQLYAFSETGLWNAQRGRAEARRGGGQAVASIGKLSQTRIVKLAAGLATEIAGPQGLLWGEAALDRGIVSKAMVFSAASSIYGGTDEIQHNIIAERTLGLPREPAPDRDRPFGDVLRG
jgi:alkylation response protein AidB-like acyl-CoA dehydrogenase